MPRFILLGVLKPLDKAAIARLSELAGQPVEEIELARAVERGVPRPPVPAPRAALQGAWGRAPELFRTTVAEFFPSEQHENAAAVAECESGFNLTAHNTSLLTGTVRDQVRRLNPSLSEAQLIEDSRGWFQINIGPSANVAFMDWNLFEPFDNVRAAFRLWSAAGWGPWACARKLGLAEV